MHIIYPVYPIELKIPLSEAMKLNKKRKFTTILLIVVILFSGTLGSEKIGWCIDEDGSHITEHETFFESNCHPAPDQLNHLHESDLNCLDSCQLLPQKPCLDITISSVTFGALPRTAFIHNQSQSPPLFYLSHSSIESPCKRIQEFPLALIHRPPSSAQLSALRTIVLLI